MSEQPKSPKELIEAGILKGRKALEELDKSGNYVYHGSPQKLHRLEPRQAHQFNPETGERKHDGEPAVAAAGNYDMAIFMAVLRGMGDKGKGDWSSFGRAPSSDKEKILFFKATKNMLDNAKDKKPIGYVHVFNKSEFEKHSGHDEWRAYTQVEPAYVVEVGVEDLPKDIEIVEPSVK